MKPTHIVLTDKGIGCIEVPVYPMQLRIKAVDELTRIIYEEALKRAMDNVVLFEDQNVWAWAIPDEMMVKGKLYPVPENYEIKIKKYYEGGFSFERCAILVPKQKDIDPEFRNSLEKNFDRLVEGLPKQEFNIGDKVMTVKGEIGTITYINNLSGDNHRADVRIGAKCNVEKVNTLILVPKQEPCTCPDDQCLLGDHPTCRWKKQPTPIEEAAERSNPYNWNISRSAYEEGFTAGAKYQENLAIKFVNWIMVMKYEIQSDGWSMWWSKDMKEYSTEDLFEIFKLYNK